MVSLLGTATPERWRVDAYVAVHHHNIARIGADNVLVMHVAEIDFWRSIRPVVRIDERKTHLLHELSNFCIGHACTTDKWLLHYQLKVSIA